MTTTETTGLVDESRTQADGPSPGRPLAFVVYSPIELVTPEGFTRLNGSTASRSRLAVATRASERLEPAPVALARPFAQVGAERPGHVAFERVLFTGPD